MAAYLKDVENNTRDMTADTIIKEKMNRIETKDVGTQKFLFNICINRNTLKKKRKENTLQVASFNRVPPATPEAQPRFKSENQQVGLGWIKSIAL